MSALELRSNLEVKQTQKLVMTPKLQQALKILQASTLQLDQIIRQELNTNPMLEEVHEGDYDEEEMEMEEEEEEEIDEQELEELLEDPFDSQYMNKDLSKSKEEPYRPEERAEITLFDHLSEQLHINFEKELDLKIGEFIIGNLDDRGYLVTSTDEIAEQLEIDKEQVEKVLSVIQTFDPYGVGARNLQECLLIQLEIRELEYEDDIIKEIVRDHWDNLTHKRYKKIAKAVGLSSPKEVEEKVKILKKMNPKPGFAFSHSRARYITPDLVVEHVEDEYQVYVNNKNIPRIRINKAYRGLILKKNPKTDKEKKAKKYLTEKYGSAKWLIKAIDQRRQTMIKTMKCIVESQREFFDKGVSHLKPMNLQEVADKIGVHESTVSRVTNDKYVQTPRGVFELKFFFDSGLGSSNGEDVSATQAKEKLKEIIANENPQKPYSDAKLSRELKKEGIIIARRTVAKYREQLGILSSRMRKKY